MKTTCIINPEAGNGSTKKLWPKIEPLLKQNIGPFESVQTRCPEEATELARQALESGSTQLISVGGDGLLNEVLNGMILNDAPTHVDATLSFIMTGTGCDFQRSWNLENNWEKTVACLKDAQTHKIDIGKVCFTSADQSKKTRYFINIASFGISGTVDQTIKNSILRDYLSPSWLFIWVTLKTLFTYPNQKIRFCLDENQEQELETRLGILANGKYFGGGMFAAPYAELDDGLLDLVLIKKVSLGKLLKLFPTIYKGTHMNTPVVIHEKVKKFSVTTSSQIPIDLDGESPGFLDATFEVLPQCLNLKI